MRKDWAIVERKQCSNFHIAFVASERFANKIEFLVSDAFESGMKILAGRYLIVSCESEIAIAMDLLNSRKISLWLFDLMSVI